MARPSPYPDVPIREFALVVAAIMFVVGSLLFVKGPIHHVRTGDALYFFGCIIFLVKAFHSVWEQWTEQGLTLCMERTHAAEYFENVLYSLSCIIFIIGCVFYWPGLFEGEANALRAECLAVWFFILGSVGFCGASYCNAMLLSRRKLYDAIPQHGRTVYNMAFAALFCAQGGGVLFVSGSLLFRPGFRNHCNRDVREEWEELAGMLERNFTALLQQMSSELNTTETRLRSFMPHKEICEDILNEGVWLFTIGSVLYLFQALIYLAIAFIKRSITKEEARAQEEEDWQDEVAQSDLSEEDL